MTNIYTTILNTGTHVISLALSERRKLPGGKFFLGGYPGAGDLFKHVLRRGDLNILFPVQVVGVPSMAGGGKDLRKWRRFYF